MVIMDGNMKNHRDVCLATHAGYAEYHGLPDMVQTGCPNTPDYKSRFCSLHKPSAPGGSSSTVDKMIIGSRSTRQGKTYEVRVLDSTVCEPLLGNWDLRTLRLQPDVRSLAIDTWYCILF